jgi:predicted DCC family thiol-disulfide oxidoreductase YuxK
MDTTGLTVLFDGGCPLCGREIAHYRKLPGLLPIQWLDVTQDAPALRGFGVSPAEAMAEFHVFDAQGRLHKGADGFVALWLALPYYRWLARACQGLRLLPLMRWGYARFARWHFRRRCASGVCG